MFATASVHAPHAGAGAYRQVGVVTGVAAASPHQLVLMLFDGFDEALAQALGALRDGAIEAKCRAIGRAARIVDEGLRANLDLNGGGALAADLRELYAYVSLRLVRGQPAQRRRRHRGVPPPDAAAARGLGLDRPRRRPSRLTPP